MMIGAIEANQTLEFENAIHFKGQLNPKEAMEISKKIENLIIDKGAHKAGPTASVSNNAFIKNGERIVDMDLFVPIDKPISIPDGFNFIPKLILENALRLRITGSPYQFESALQALIAYINKNKLTPNTPPVIVTVKKPTSQFDLEEMITDIYIGINQ